MMGKLSFFLGLQISQSPRGIFLNQSKYALESLKKYGMETSDSVDTLMVEKSKLDEDPLGKAVDPTYYHGMIGTLMYLTSRTINMGLWNSKDSCIALTAFVDADNAGCQDTRKSTSGSMQLLGDRLDLYSIIPNQEAHDLLCLPPHRARTPQNHNVTSICAYIAPCLPVHTPLDFCTSSPCVLPDTKVFLDFKGWKCYNGSWALFKSHNTSSSITPLGQQSFAPYDPRRLKKFKR
ncbi:uncharacterized mitochondrial protein-like protein [Tanacetum coccineum]